jgi:FAD-dependent urate hydroxylase
VDNKTHETKLLIVGAGPYGLATAALAKAHGISHLIFGKQMGLWRDHMPSGMVLRSDTSWHFDPLGIHTYEAFLLASGRACTPDTLISRADFLEYADWYCREKEIQPDPRQIIKLQHRGGHFIASLNDGHEVVAEKALLTIGYQYFLNLPQELTSKIPSGKYSHTFQWADFASLAGKTCLIIGGRQSAYESAALIAEQAKGVRVHVSHRKATPAFAQSNWDFVNDLVASTLRDPSWYRNLSQKSKDEVATRFYKEGRLQLEPWLESRVKHHAIESHPESQVVSTMSTADDRLSVELSNGKSLVVDHVILATGYKADVARIPFLDSETVLSKLQIQEGFPKLSPNLESSLPWLFFGGLTATRDFGLIFGFVKGAPVTASLVINRIKRG